MRSYWIRMVIKTEDGCLYQERTEHADRTHGENGDTGRDWTDMSIHQDVQEWPAIPEARKPA